VDSFKNRVGIHVNMGKVGVETGRYSNMFSNNILNIEDRTMPTTAAAFLQDVENLISLPDVCFRVNEMADDPHASAVDIAEVIGQDPNLVTQLLRIANSPYYGFPSRVDTISRAIAVIGTQDLRDLVLSASIINAFNASDNEIIDLHKYWSHSLFTGFVARQLGSRTKVKVLCKERLFVAGLLHDIGQLVMSMKIPEIMRIIVHRANLHAEPFHETEKLVFGLGHAEVGGQLLSHWHLPESLQAVARYHHQPENAKEYLLEVSIVHIANAMAHLMDLPGLGTKEKIKVSPVAWESTGLNKKLVVAAVKRAKLEFDNSISAFMPYAQVANQ